MNFQTVHHCFIVRLLSFVCCHLALSLKFLYCQRMAHRVKGRTYICRYNRKQLFSIPASFLSSISPSKGVSQLSLFCKLLFYSTAVHHSGFIRLLNIQYFIDKGSDGVVVFSLLSVSLLKLRCPLVHFLRTGPFTLFDTVVV